MPSTCSRMSGAWIVVNEVAKRLYSSTTLSRRENTSSAGPLASVVQSVLVELVCVMFRIAIPGGGSCHSVHTAARPFALPADHGRCVLLSDAVTAAATRTLPDLLHGPSLSNDCAQHLPCAVVSPP